MTDNHYHLTGPEAADKDAHYVRPDEYRLFVTLEINGKPHKACVVIDTRELEAMRSIDRCDDPMIAFIAGGKTAKQAMEIDQQRQQLAKVISAQVTEVIMKQIKSQDTINGYGQ